MMDMQKRYMLTMTEEMEKKLEAERKKRLLDSIPETVRMILSEYLSKWTTENRIRQDDVGQEDKKRAESIQTRDRSLSDCNQQEYSNEAEHDWAEEYLRDAVQCCQACNFVGREEDGDEK